ncbi:MAG: GNAT family protein [Bacteroidia bacterium]
MDNRPYEIAPGFAFPEVKTYLSERIIYREVRPNEHVKLLHNENEKLVRQFLYILDDKKWELEKLKELSGFSMWSFSFCNFFLFDREFGQPLGHCGYHTWSLRHQKAELGYMIYDSSNYGKGLMQEACKFVIDFGFNEMNLIRIEAMTSSSNEASKRILMKAGFREEGLLSKNYLKDGKAEDSILFGLVNPNGT